MHLKVLTSSIELCYDGQGEEGQVVLINVRKKEYYGIISKVCAIKHEYNLKEIIEYTPWVLSAKFLRFIKIFQYVFYCEGMIIKYLNKLWPKIIKKKTKKISFNPVAPKLTEDQQKAYLELKKNKKSFLWGVTGSGKTLIIIKIIQEYLLRKEQVLLMVPEIAIGEHFSETLKTFNIPSVFWNSKSKNKGKFQDIMLGKALVVIGTRSSIFLPFKNLKLIVVDEEHSSSYYQESRPTYSGRDGAFLRAQSEDISIILMSATPSAESVSNFNKKLHPVYLFKRFNDKPLAKIRFISPKEGAKENKNFSQELVAPLLLEKIQERIKNKETVLVFCNRRALAPVIKCKNCFHRQKCDRKNCDATLIAHKKYYQCHKCHKRFPPNKCLYCDNSQIVTYGFGVDKVAEYLGKKFPEIKIGILSSDHCNDKNKLIDFLKKVHAGYFSIIIGTQMIAKGHNFPNLNMAILLNIDNLGVDFRIIEHSLQTIIQVAGRIGREKSSTKGEIFIQHIGENPYKNEIINQDYQSFIYRELTLRQSMLLPPFSKLIYIESSKNHKKILDRILSCPSVIHIFMETYPKVLFSCKKEHFPKVIKKILFNIWAYKLQIY